MVCRKICLHVRVILLVCEMKMISVTMVCRVWPKSSLIVSSVLPMYRAYRWRHGSGWGCKKRVAFQDVCFTKIRADGTDDFVPNPVASESDPQADKERKSLRFFFRRHPYPACQVFLSAQTPDGDLKIPTEVINNALPVFRSACQSKQKTGREAIQPTCPKETSKGQWSTTKCISSICCIQQDVANASSSLPLRGEQEKGCTRGKSLLVFIGLWLQKLLCFCIRLEETLESK